MSFMSGGRDNSLENCALMLVVEVVYVAAPAAVRCSFPPFVRELASGTAGESVRWCFSPSMLGMSWCSIKWFLVYKRTSERTK